MDNFKTAEKVDDMISRDAQLDKAFEEITSLKAAEKILMESITDKDKLISNMYEDKEKHINLINDKQHIIQILENDKQKLLSETGTYEHIKIENEKTNL